VNNFVREVAHEQKGNLLGISQVIIHANFGDDPLRGFGVAGGGQFFSFSIGFRRRPDNTRTAFDWQLHDYSLCPVRYIRADNYRQITDTQVNAFVTICLHLFVLYPLGRGPAYSGPIR